MSHSEAQSAVNVYESVDDRGVITWSTRSLEPGKQPSFVIGKALIGNEHGVIAQADVLPSLGGLPPPRLRSLVNRVAKQHGIEPHFVLGLISVESNFNEKAVSAKGARGLMQLMPATASIYGITRANDLFDPEKNLVVGVRHLKHLLDRHEGNWALALASYNAGSGAVHRHGQRIPRYRETMLYVPSVLSRAFHFRSQSHTSSPSHVVP